MSSKKWQQHLILNDKEKTVGTFWREMESGEIDEDNLPSKKEMVNIIEWLLNGGIKVEETSNIIREDD